MGVFSSDNNDAINIHDCNFDNAKFNNINNKTIINQNNSLNTSSNINNSFLRYNNFNNSNSFNINNNLNSIDKMNLINNKISKVNSVIKGYLLRKKFKEYLQTDLMDYTNELYFHFIEKSKNKKLSKLKPEISKKLLEYRRTDFSEFYQEDPNKEINKKLHKMKTYINGMIFEYPNKTFYSDDLNICVKNALSCYKGSIDLYTSKKFGYGELIYADGSQKIGTFYNDEFIGWNTYIDSEGILYVGLFKENKLNGKGLKYILDKDCLYKGDFLNFKRHGHGKYWKNSSTYEGQFNCDKKHGQGKITFKTGDVYIGEFKNNTINGFGQYIWKNGKHIYKGNFLNGKFHGEGLYKWEDNEYFKGTYFNGVKEGKGEIGYNNGKKCYVNFKKGKPDGKGILIDENKNEIEVEFVDGIMVKNNDKNL